MLAPPPTPTEWYFDSGTGSYMAMHSGILTSSTTSFNPPNIVIGNGSVLPVTSTGCLSFPSTRGPLALNNVLVTPNLIKNLISVRQFTTDNSCPIEFDPFGVSLKDLHTGP